MHYLAQALRISATATIIGLGLTLSACGGGGGGNSGPAGITYTGSTQQSNVNDTNTPSYSSAIMDGSQDSQENLGGIIGGTFTSPDGSGSTEGNNKQHAMLTQLVEQVKDTIEANRNSDSAQTTGFVPQSTGNCGGTSSVTSNNTTYTITYNSYCTSIGGTSITMSGSISATVTLDASNNLSAMQVTFNRFKMVFVDINAVSHTNEFSGSISVTLTSSGDLDNMTISMNFIEGGKVYRMENMQYSASGSSVSISGKIYHPDHGYITFVTNSPFQMVDDQLCGGVLTATGANGSNFTVTVASDCSTYTYSGIDENGASFGGTF